MGIEYRSYNLGDEITPLVKTMSQEAINDFEGSAGVKHPTQFTDTEFAQERLDGFALAYRRTQRRLLMKEGGPRPLNIYDPTMKSLAVRWLAKPRTKL